MKTTVKPAQAERRFECDALISVNLSGMVCERKLKNIAMSVGEEDWEIEDADQDDIARLLQEWIERNLTALVGFDDDHAPDIDFEVVVDEVVVED